MTNLFFFYPHILENLPIPEKGFDVCRDMGDKRLRLYVTARGVKTFFVRKRVKGKDLRIILGSYPKLSIDEARAMIDPALGKMLAPAPEKKKRVKFRSACKTFVAEKIHRSPESSQKLARAMNALWGPVMDKNIGEITTGELSDLFAGMAQGHGAATANRMREIIKSLFNFAVQRNWADGNPAAGVAPVSESRRKNKLTPAGLRKILGKIKREKNPVLRSAFLMLVFGFMRKSEVFSMNWNDLDMKTDFYKSHPLTDSAAVLLRNLPQAGKWVFPNGRGGHISDPRVSWRKIAKSAGLDDVQMNDCTKLLRSDLKWSNQPETLRRNMNAVLEKMTMTA
ncbi:MAG: integrase family protein [Rickettsiales bacterium]|jgi:integrase|nr:integrase family protein [Rickettsiales bacterium]